MPSTPERPALAILGAGPRGTSILERIGAYLTGSLRQDPPGKGLDIHVVDEAEAGAGRIWRTEQTRELCMNTLADAVTLFTEPGSTVAGPVVPGPTLYEWSLLALAAAFPDDAGAARATEIPASRASAFLDVPVRAGFAAEYREELAAMRPESHPSRALYGEYLRWCFDRATAALPTGVRLVQHGARAVSVRREGDSERVELSDGTTLVVDTVIVATGWMQRAETPAERRLAAALESRPELLWVRPDSPADQDLTGVPAGSDVIVRGLGMGFFDTMALLTVSRGGRFAPDASASGGLRYEASGREPILHVTSGRGVPFRAKTLYGSLPPRAEQRFLLGTDWSEVRRPIDFDHALWPRIAADAHLDYYTTLHRVRPEAFAGPLERVVGAIEETLDFLLDPATRRSIEQRTDRGDEQFSDRAGAPAWLATVPRLLAETLAPLIPDPADRFDLAGELDPAAGSFESPAAYNAWVGQRVILDLHEAELGRDSALKAGLWSVSSARGAAARIGTLGGFDAESRRSGFAALHAVGGMAGSGPPAFRNRQLLALVEAGLVHFIGPAAAVDVGEGGFVTRSPRVAGSEVTATVLVDAWMHVHDVSESADPLVRSLVEAGRARPFRVASRQGEPLATGGFDIDPGTGLLVGVDDTVDPAVHVVGIPVDETLHDTIISPMPGTDPAMLRETDRVARSALRIALHVSHAGRG